MMENANTVLANVPDWVVPSFIQEKIVHIGKVVLHLNICKFVVGRDTGNGAKAYLSAITGLARTVVN